MAKAKFFVEGPEDRNFIKQYCNIVFGSNVTDRDFTIMNGWSGYKTGGTSLPEFSINADDGCVNLLIADADNDYDGRKNEIIGDKAKLSFEADIFLFPNDNDSGCLENLLTKIAVDIKLIECFRNYEICVKDYKRPLLKGRIYTYLDTLLYPHKVDPKTGDLRLLKNFDFGNKEHWDLANAYLNPLFNFLKPYFQE